MFLFLFFFQDLKPPGNVLFFEQFDEGSLDRWKISKNEKYKGEWSISETFPPQGRKNETALIQLTRNAHHAISTVLPSPISLDRKNPLVIQYEFRAQHSLSCSGAYLKLFSCKNFDPEKMDNNTQWTIMFGPDRCGETHSIRLIFNIFNPIKQEMEERQLINPPSFPSDRNNHLFTLIIRPNASFEIRLDNTIARSGSLYNDFEPPIVPNKFIQKSDEKKPKNWDEREFIEEIEERDENPEESNNENQPELIPDQNAQKPEYWDEKILGKWEPPLIRNPKSKQPMKAEKTKLVKNPNYKGKWETEMIENPDYYPVQDPTNLPSITGLGFELWCTNKLLSFTNILIAKNEEEIIEWNNEDFLPRKNIQVNYTKPELNQQKENTPQVSKRTVNLTILKAFIVEAGILLVYFILYKLTHRKQKAD